METQYSLEYPDRIEYGFWLAFNLDGSMSFSLEQPSLAPSQHAMRCVAKIPLSLFSSQLTSDAVFDAATPADMGELVEPELLDQAVSFAEMWGTEQNWPHVRDAYVAAILRERAKLSPRPSFRKTIPNYPEYDNARSK